MRRLGLWSQNPLEIRKSLRPMYYEETELDLFSEEEIMERNMPITMGQEIEQFEEWIPRNIVQELSRKGAYHDGSGPFEWTYGPFNLPNQWIKWLYKDVHYPDGIWEWKKEHERRRGRYTGMRKGCGSHIHFRPTEHDDPINWSVIWNTLNDFAPFMIPLMIQTPYNRESASYWAKYYYRRYNPSSIARMLEFSPSRQYKFLTPNPRTTEKPLTFELRLPEAHPVLNTSFQRVVLHTLVQVFKSRDSIKLAGREHVESWIHNAMEYSQNVYGAMRDSGPIVFTRKIPYINKYEFDNALEVFKHVIHYLMSRYPKDRRFKDYFWRVLWFVYFRGDASREPWENLWKCFKETDFQWQTVPPYTGELPKPEQI